jgi:hypothetical protein
MSTCMYKAFCIAEFSGVTGRQYVVGQHVTGLMLIANVSILIIIH